MKSFGTLFVCSFLAGTCYASASEDEALPIERVVKLIAGLKARVEEDGKNEQKSYDKYACWCEDTLERKAADISDAKELVAETETLIKKLKAEIASHGAEVQQLNKDIAQNAKAVKEATNVRDKEYNDYNQEKMDSESCIGAMEHAIKVLTGAGTGKFLDTTKHEAQLLSIAGQVQRVLKHPSLPQSINQNDIDLVNDFVAQPLKFFHSNGMSAAQVSQNPFGDYAPQSTQIQGILKGMYDAFTGDLEKDNVNEAESQKSFEALMATKQTEKDTLVATLQKQETDSAEKTKQLSESKVLKDDTLDQLEADTAFFADTKDACQAKASEWAVRTRLRVEELSGMAQAIAILSSKDAKKTLKSSATTFLQLSSVKKHQADRSGAAMKAYSKLRIVAAQSKSIEVARIAMMAQSGGHFDKIMGMIDMMITDLRAEEQDDIAHRDMCENQNNANGNEIADLKGAIEKTKKALQRMENTKKGLEGEITALEKDIDKTKSSQAELLNFRNEDVKEFRQALKDDADAMELMKQATAALTKFYKDNKIPLGLTQKPEYDNNPDRAPEVFSGDYGGRKSESTGILAILGMLIEDVEKEMAEARADDADAQAKYEAQNAALQETLDAQEETKVSTEADKADLQAKIKAFEKYQNAKNNDKGSEEDKKKALATECAWVKTHFKTRREKRKSEIQGLIDAKAFLAGDGQEPL